MAKERYVFELDTDDEADCIILLRHLQESGKTNFHNTMVALLRRQIEGAEAPKKKVEKHPH